MLMAESKYLNVGEDLPLSCDGKGLPLRSYRDLSHPKSIERDTQAQCPIILLALGYEELLCPQWRKGFPRYQHSCRSSLKYVYFHFAIAICITRKMLASLLKESLPLESSLRHPTKQLGRRRESVRLIHLCKGAEVLLKNIETGHCFNAQSACNPCTREEPESSVCV